MVGDSTVVVLDIVVRSKGLIGIVVAAEVDIVVAVGIDRNSSMVDTTETTVDTGSRVL